MIRVALGLALGGTLESARLVAADTPAEAQPATLASLDPELARLDGLIHRIHEPAAQALERARYDGFIDRRRGLAIKFDSTVFSDLRYSVTLASQRLARFLAPPALPAGAPPPSTRSTLPEYRPPQPRPLDLRAAPGPTRPVTTAVAPSPISETDALDFTDHFCSACHNDEEFAGQFDLAKLDFKSTDPTQLARWAQIHDRVKSGEMPPKKRRQRPGTTESTAFVDALSAALVAVDQQQLSAEGRATQRRLNRSEFEHALRDLLHAPWLQLRASLPDDGIAYRYNKVGEALDISHVQMARFIGAADQAMREVVSVALAQREPTVTRYYARNQKSVTNNFLQRTIFNGHPERMGFPIIGTRGQPEVWAGSAPVTVGDAQPDVRDQEAIATVHGSSSDAFNYRWDQFRAPVAGRYRMTFRGYTVWVGPYGYTRSFEGEKDRVGRPGMPNWFQPNPEDISVGRRDEPITIYSEGPGLTRLIGSFDLGIQPNVQSLDAWLLKGETLSSDAARFYRSRPGQVLHAYTNPHAQSDGMPGVAFQWMEIEGPFYDEAVDTGYRVLFGDLPLQKKGEDGWTVVSQQPLEDARRLLTTFMKRAYRKPVPPGEVDRFLAVVAGQLTEGQDFAEALITGYTAALVSPGFIFLDEKPGPLDDHALASRLAFFLWNSPPDAALRELAATGALQRPEVLQAQTDRMLNDPKSLRFVEAFLDYWLDLRNLDETTPSITLYPDYYLDNALQESALQETQLYFAQMLRSDLPARYVVDSEFTFLNERLAQHYGIDGVKGVTMRPYVLPKGSVRGGLLTQASVLKVTANGTTTSPVLRGKWITERILGHIIPPPPPVAAVEPDIRGAVTIREQLAKHRADPSCASCHSKMDPPGFALESFDTLGGYRARYRAADEAVPPEPGFGMNGHAFFFHDALPVDAAGELPDGRTFTDVVGFKKLLLRSEDELARNLAQQLTIYATGAPLRFIDRQQIDAIIQASARHGYGVRGLVHLIVQSALFRQK